MDPLTLFHLDSRGDTPNSENITDDIFINLDGNVGIGTYPSTDSSIKLKVAGKMKINDGTQDNGKILIGDSDLNTTWSNKTLRMTINGNRNTHQLLTSAPNISNISQFMRPAITLPPGT